MPRALPLATRSAGVPPAGLARSSNCTKDRRGIDVGRVLNPSAAAKWPPSGGGRVENPSHIRYTFRKPAARSGRAREIGAARNVATTRSVIRDIADDGLL